MATALSHSFSAIKMFENCPLRYYHQRIAKTVTDQGGEASQHGERIHKYIEDRLKGTLSPEYAAEIAKLEPIIASIELVAKGGTLEVEQQLTLNKELKPTEWFAKDAWMRSILDVFVRRGKKAMVCDWKTGKRRPDFTQLELFALQVFAHYPEVEKVETGFIWTQDLAFDRETYTRQDAPAMWAKLLERVNRIERAKELDVWPARPSGLCRYCPCNHFCEAA
jgi:CRISPR/Cas system-associated exonuclease Cas4 (RecB family)